MISKPTFKGYPSNHPPMKVEVKDKYIKRINKKTTRSVKKIETAGVVKVITVVKSIETVKIFSKKLDLGELTEVEINQKDSSEI